MLIKIRIQTLEINYGIPINRRLKNKDKTQRYRNKKEAAKNKNQVSRNKIRVSLGKSELLKFKKVILH